VYYKYVNNIFDFIININIFKNQFKKNYIYVVIMSDTQKNANSSNDETVFDGTRQIGRVKWFNNRAGFGFITMLEGEKKGEDVFTHHSGISVDTEQYKYLVQGEYVTFELRASDNTDHPYQAGKVKGVLEGMLMCETRTSMRKDTRAEGGGEYDTRRPRRRVRARGSGPRDDENGGGKRWQSKEWNNDRQSGKYDH